MAQTHRGDMRPSEREIGRAGQPSMGAHDLLDDDHNRVLQMFNEYENLGADGSRAEKTRIARMVCRELKIHTQIEEEIYYPCVRSRSDAEDMVDDAHHDHDRASELIKDIEMAATDDPSFDTLVRQLASEVRRHISEEREKIFEIAEIADCDTAEMARNLLNRKRELEQEIR